MNKKLLYISSNLIWGGSEILWTQSLKKFSSQKVDVCSATYYNLHDFSPDIDLLAHFDLSQRFEYPDLYKRLKAKLFHTSASIKDLFTNWMAQQNPDLVIISQGNNIDGLPFMEIAKQLGFPFITLSQLVTEILWISTDDAKLLKLNHLYKASKMNFFVSRHNLALHEKMTGFESTNLKVIFNPFSKPDQEPIAFPGLEKGYYKLALLGRLDVYHKGHDLLIEVLNQPKWKKRNVKFSFFGTGPHQELLTRLIRMHDIKNISIHQHTNDVRQIWASHHLLIMPSRMEGQSLALIESMFYKRACIVTHVGGTDELVIDGETGFLAEHPDVQSLDQAMEKAWANRAKWEEMGDRAHQHISNVHPLNAVQHFNDQLNEILGL